MNQENGLVAAGLSVCLWLLLRPTPCMADTIMVNPVARYAGPNVGNEGVRACDWNKKIVEYLRAYSRGRVVVTDADLATVDGQTLDLVVTNVHAAGGGGYSGPKWGYLRATLANSGKVITTFEVASRSMSGGSWTACGTLDRIAKALGSKTAKQLRRIARMRSAAVAKEQTDESDTDHTPGKDDVEKEEN